MTKKSKSAEVYQEIGEEAATPLESAEQTAGRVFDFTGPIHLLEGENKRVYYQLRRAAILAGDAGQLPDGKVYTEAKVIAILGEDYASVQIPAKCCG